MRRKDVFFGLVEAEGQRNLVVIGVPWDATSSYQRGVAYGPDAIRLATDGKLYNRFTEDVVDLATKWKVCDHGNVRVDKRTNARTLEGRIYNAVTQHHHQAQSTLLLGGDHFITYPCFCSIARLKNERLSLLYFDAHPDLYDRYDGSEYSHATVVSRVLERAEFSTGQVCYVGIRASTKEQEDRITRFRLIEFTARDVYTQGCEQICAKIKSALSDHPVYLSIDLDCLDPSFAPAGGHQQPGGMSTRQLFDILHGLERLRVVASDVVEYSPPRDSGRITASAAAILIKELLGLMSRD